MGKTGLPSGLRLAAVDIGTNSVLMMLAGRGPGGRLHTILESLRVCRLGQGMAAEGGRISAESARRTLEALRELKAEAQRNGASRLYAVGTECLRTAANAPEFVAEARAILDAPIEILTGEREAQLAWLGVTGGRYPSRPVSLLDIGGGSTEWVRGSARGILPPVSVPVGALTLAEQFPDEDAAALSGAAAAALVGAGLVARPSDNVTVIGGTATTLAALLKGVKTFDHRKIEGTRLAMADVLGLLNRLASLDPAARNRLPGMDAERVGTIVPGTVLLAVAMKVLDAREVTVSTRGLRHGLLIEAFGMGKEEGAAAGPGRTSAAAAPGESGAGAGAG